MIPLPTSCPCPRCGYGSYAYDITNASSPVVVFSTEPACTAILEGSQMGDHGDSYLGGRARNLKAERRAALEALRKKQSRRR